MNIESANLPSLAASSTVAVVESMSQPSADGSAVTDSFSGALVAQIGLLNTVEAGDSLPLQAPDVTGLQSVVSDFRRLAAESGDHRACHRRECHDRH